MKLWAIFTVLIVLWILSVVALADTLGGYIVILLILVMVYILVRVIKSNRPI
ncbi:MAG: DUF5670 family protein [Chlorobi bacterium]|nr:DUF5670 family protein [Chlorobiota bacterium]MCI0715515.1 DUF5670 family protein [Chlorobiota bacterium]